MPYLPPDVNCGTLSNDAFTPEALERWMDVGQMPITGPHAARDTRNEWGCKLLGGGTDQATKTVFKKGMQGHALGEAVKSKTNGKWIRKIYIPGVTEHRTTDGNLVPNQWVPADQVRIGATWKKPEDWVVTMHLRPWNATATTLPNAPDSSRLGKAIFQLISSFKSSPASFMGSKLDELIQKRSETVESLTQAIINGIKTAGLYDVLNRPNFTAVELIGAARHQINQNYPLGKGCGVYMRRHVASSTVTHWSAGCIYIYVGKARDFRSRFDEHPNSTSKYGDLTRNSRELTMIALCVLAEQDYQDCGYLVEQVFVCLFQTYRANVLTSLAGKLDSDTPVERAKALQAAHYFSNLAANVFQQTGFAGGVKRRRFGVHEGANYESPFVEWCGMTEQTLFVRNDTYHKDFKTMESMPVAIFRTSKPRVAHYSTDIKYPNIFRMWALKKSHNNKAFLAFGHSSKIIDGSEGPAEGDLFYTVFEVRTDGGPHPHSWSRLPSIASFGNWDQGRSLAVRIEWEYPKGSGMWRYRYIQSGLVMNFIDNCQYGCNKNYMKSIALTRWLFNAGDVPNAPAFQERLAGSAYVIQTYYDNLSQTVDIREQQPIRMVSATFLTVSCISQQMKSLGLLNMDGDFGHVPGGPAMTSSHRKSCDTCVLIGPGPLARWGLVCTQLPGHRNRCRVCHIMGRPFCSWTGTAAVRESSEYSDLQKKGGRVGEGNTTKFTGDDLQQHEIVAAGLHRQPAWKNTGQGQNFKQPALEARSKAQAEDDTDDSIMEQDFDILEEF